MLLTTYKPLGFDRALLMRVHIEKQHYIIPALAHTQAEQESRIAQFVNVSYALHAPGNRNSVCLCHLTNKAACSDFFAKPRLLEALSPFVVGSCKLSSSMSRAIVSQTSV